MKKDVILEKSRQENKDQDVFDLDVQRDGRNIAAVVAIILATVFYIVQIALGGGQNYALYAIVASILATTFIVKAVRMKKRHEIAVAVLYTLATLALSAAHIYTLIAG